PPMIDGLPPIAVAKVAELSASQLAAHGLEGVLRWKIEYEPFWAEFFQRLTDVLDEVSVGDALQLVRVFAQLRSVHLDSVAACVAKVCDAEAEILLDLKETDLAYGAEALATMQETEALAVVLRVLASRVYRLEIPLATRLLDACRQVLTHDTGTTAQERMIEASSAESSDFADALCRAVVEKEDMPYKQVVEVAEATARLAEANLYRIEPRCGLEILFQHALRRGRTETTVGSADVERLVVAARSSCKSQVAALQKLQQQKVQNATSDVLAE
ncbi:unnamed protein product, partial [Symbiodinium pilosum]